MSQREIKTLSALFNYVWENREHVSEVSGLPLLNKNHFKWAWQMAHILPKGTYPKYKFNPDNIMLMLPEEHERQETFEIFRDKQLKLKQEYYTEFYNKNYDQKSI